MIDEQLYDASFVERYTSGFEQLVQAVKETTPEWAAAQADVPADVIVRVTRELAACAPHAIVSLVIARRSRRKRSICGV